MPKDHAHYVARQVTSARKRRDELLADFADGRKDRSEPIRPGDQYTWGFILQHLEAQLADPEKAWPDNEASARAFYQNRAIRSTP